MTIGFILNGEDVVLNLDAEYRLVDILRDIFKLRGTKNGCYAGTCGSCSVIYNGNVAKSCLIPAFKIQGSEIITIEAFSQTDEYRDIVQGFAKAGLENCGICNTGKILSTQALLGRNLRPSKDEILLAFYGVRCRCTEPEELVEGVMAVIECRRRRLNELS
ncbi:MAG: 2Fe-2S iron-sulfur cluster binding domain-containing protein [Treponema sp.]|nr:2Fe-2S iron-sulfur cluster binding domain-containing protein [Treponema sp.]